MTIPGETVGMRSTVCMDCKARLYLKVLHSNAGYYIGFWCDYCGPYSRESGYYKTRELADTDLATNSSWRRC
jgi:hypothetical protein